MKLERLIFNKDMYHGVFVGSYPDLVLRENVRDAKDMAAAMEKMGFGCYGYRFTFIKKGVILVNWLSEKPYGDKSEPTPYCVGVQRWYNGVQMTSVDFTKENFDTMLQGYPKEYLSDLHLPPMFGTVPISTQTTISANGVLATPDLTLGCLHLLSTTHGHHWKHLKTFNGVGTKLKLSFTKSVGNLWVVNTNPDRGGVKVRVIRFTKNQASLVHEENFLVIKDDVSCTYPVSGTFELYGEHYNAPKNRYNLAIEYSRCGVDKVLVLSGCNQQNTGLERIMPEALG